jgi:hypothetical protein
VDDTSLRRILEAARTIAVLGAHLQVERPAYYVAAYLQRHGRRILPVNPRFVGQRLFGEPFVATLAELEDAVDLVDVFRRSDALAGHVDDILAMDPRPSVVWFQLGIRNDAVAQKLQQAGIEVVSDRCALAEHRRLGLR